MCQKWDSNPRLHSETRKPVGKGNLESGALDHSAILTLHVLLLHAEPDVCDTCQRPMSVVIQAYSPCPQPPDPAN